MMIGRSGEPVFGSKNKIEKVAEQALIDRIRHVEQDLDLNQKLLERSRHTAASCEDEIQNCKAQLADLYEALEKLKS